MCPSISAASSPCLMLKCVLCCSESYPSCMLLLAYQSLLCSVAQPSSQICSIRRSRVFPQFHCQISHYLCFILWLVESRRFANRCRHCWCDLCPLGPFRSRFAPHLDQWPFICRHHHHVISLPAVLQQWTLSSPFGWFDTSQVIVKFKTPKQGSCLRNWCTGLWRLGLFAEVRLWRRYPLVEAILFYIDKFKSCTLRRHLWFWTSDVSCINFMFMFESSA